MATISPQRKSAPPPTDLPKKRQKTRQIMLNMYTLAISLFSGIILLCFFYLSEFNAISSQGVIINDLESERNELIIANEVWNMRIAQLKSMDVIQHQDVVQRMVTISPSEIEFINLDQKGVVDSA
jgi:hypothetical protein